jgi:hypothetical protein
MRSCKVKFEEQVTQIDSFGCKKGLIVETYGSLCARHGLACGVRVVLTLLSIRIGAAGRDNLFVPKQGVAIGIFAFGLLFEEAHFVGDLVFDDLQVR